MALYGEAGMIGVVGAMFVYLVVSLSNKSAKQQETLEDLKVENRGQSETLENSEKMIIALIDRWNKSTNRLIQLLFLALAESKKGNRCQKCMGVGTIATFKCENCEGSGFRRPTLKSRADALQTDPRNFKKRWQYQYEKFVLPLVTELDIELASINRKIG